MKQILNPFKGKQVLSSIYIISNNSIDEVRMYDRALTDEEIQLLFDKYDMCQNGEVFNPLDSSCVKCNIVNCGSCILEN